MSGYYANMYSGVDYKFMDIDDVTDPTSLPGNITAIDNYFDEVVRANAVDSIISICMFPKPYYSNDSNIPTFEKVFTKPTRNGNYTPRNNKLLTFPYTYLAVSGGNQLSLYRYEFFSTTDARFDLNGCTTANPEIACIPKNYKGSTGRNYVEETVISGFPQVAFTIDSFKAWLAQTAGGSLALLDLGQQAFNAVAGFGYGTYRGAVGAVNSLFGLGQTIAVNVREATKGDTSKGNITGGIDTTNRAMGFWFRRMGLLEEYAKIIDDFFDRFGYASNKLKVPYRHARNVYTYTQTIDCTIAGGCPSDDAKKISEIFNKGITFWANPWEVGRYKSSDGTAIQNAPLGENAS